MEIAIFALCIIAGWIVGKPIAAAFASLSQ